MTEEELEEYKLEVLNKQVGHLKYYDCPKCLNKGVIYVRKEDTIFHDLKRVAIKCECSTIRKVYENLANCGIDEYTFKRYTFDNFETTELWQEKLKQKCLDYVAKIKADKKAHNNWLVISGISGCGKTMLCTAIFKELIQLGLNAKYFMWKEETTKLKQLRNSSFSESIELYEKSLNELKNVDILYIDDFLKLMDIKSKENDLNLAYEIINTRYANNKITLFSTEYSKEELNDFDKAICGRICEKAGKNFIQLAYDEKRNYRMKKEII